MRDETRAVPKQETQRLKRGTIESLVLFFLVLAQPMAFLGLSLHEQGGSNLTLSLSTLFVMSLCITSLAPRKGSWESIGKMFLEGVVLTSSILFLIFFGIFEIQLLAPFVGW